MAILYMYLLTIAHFKELCSNWKAGYYGDFLSIVWKWQFVICCTEGIFKDLFFKFTLYAYGIALNEFQPKMIFTSLIGICLCSV